MWTRHGKLYGWVGVNHHTLTRVLDFPCCFRILRRVCASKCENNMGNCSLWRLTCIKQPTVLNGHLVIRAPGQRLIELLRLVCVIWPIIFDIFTCVCVSKHLCLCVGQRGGFVTNWRMLAAHALSSSLDFSKHGILS